jgi:hypothetical protein
MPKRGDKEYRIIMEYFFIFRYNFSKNIFKNGGSYGIGDKLPE